MDRCRPLATIAAVWVSMFVLNAVTFAQEPLQSSPVDSAEQVQFETAFDGSLAQPQQPEYLSGDSDIAARLNALQSQIDSLKSNAGPSAGLAPGRARTTDIVRPEDAIKTPSFPVIKLTGVFQADAGWFAQDTANINEFGNIQDLAGFRRARLAAVGDVAENVSYIIEMDFAFPGRPNFMDVWLDVHDIPVLGNVRVGQWRQPFGMDVLTSVRELTFLERSLPFAFTPFRQVGAGFHDNNHEKTVTWAASVYRFPTDNFADAFGDKGYGMAGRVTALPIEQDDGRFLVHVGGDYSLNRPSTTVVRYRNSPEFGGPFGGPTGAAPSVPFFVDTAAIPASMSNLFNAEAAVVCGSAYAQSELTYAVVSQQGGPTLTFPGMYVQAGYFLTGEVRQYNKTNAVLGRVTPNCAFGKDRGCGAWELASRWSYLNLNDANINGGQLNDYTLGLNWYLNTYTKFQFNYIHAFLKDAVVGRSDADIVALRAQLDF